MKLFLKNYFFLAFVIFTLIPQTGKAQWRFRGDLVYTIFYQDSIAKLDTANMLPQKMTVTVRKNMIKSVIDSKIGSYSIIADTKDKTSVLLINTNDSTKVALKTDKKTLLDATQEYKNAKVKYTDSTKLIKGYNCHKAIVKYEDQTSIVWYTKQLKINDMNWFSKYLNIDGVLFDYSTQMHNVNMHFKIDKINKRWVKKAEFEIPPEYEQVSVKDL